jgi:hypothetical protein
VTFWPPALIALAAVIGIHLFAPADHGIGTYPGPAQLALLLVGVAAAVTGIALQAVRMRRADGDRHVVGRCSLGILLLLALGGYNAAYLVFLPHTVDVGSAGFARAGYHEDWDDDQVVLRNGSKQPVTICYGVAGICASDSFAPARLDPPGVTLRPGHYMTLGLHNVDRNLRLTMAGTGQAVTVRDTLIQVGAPAITTGR